MKKMTLYFFICAVYLIFFNFKIVSADNLIMNQTNYAIEENKLISLYKNNVIIGKFNNAKLLDLNETYLLYNIDDTITLYNIENNSELIVSEKAYNAMIYKDKIIFESDKSDEYRCKNVVGSVTYRNCYKLYLYEIDSKTMSLIQLNGNDSYLNDIEEDYLVYTSIHNKDDFCDSICSYINVYDFKLDNNVIIQKYDDLALEMSGNALIDNSIVYFESIPNILGCSYTQVFFYDIKSMKIDMISKTSTNCFTKNSEIIYANDGYLLFKSDFQNYNDNTDLNYIYSISDDKYTQTNYGHYPLTIIYESSLIVMDEGIVKYKSIDDISPTINCNKQYQALKENEQLLINQLEYQDNLSKRENISVELLNDLSNVGNNFIKVRLCDKFNNCSIYEVLVEVIDKDTQPPKIYYNDSIVMKINEEFNIEKYGYALDNVDGKTIIELVGDIDFSKKGTYTILIKSTDTSGNSSYKEVELVIYDNYKIYWMYFIFVALTLFVIIIIYVLRFKKVNRF